MALYQDLTKPAAKGPGGRPACVLLDQVTVYTRLVASNKLVYRCLGAPMGCTKNYPVNRDKDRVLKHASTCQYLPQELRQAVNSSQAQQAPSVLVEKLAANPSAVASSRRDGRIEVFLGPQKPSGTPASQPTPGDASQPSVQEIAKKEGKKQLRVKLDSAIVNLICVGGIPPRVADLDEWKTAWTTANSAYQPASRSTIEDVHIPSEASAVDEKQLDFLRTQSNLTISFDGGTLKSTQANTTIHVITEDRRVFFFDGIDSTGFSHTGDYYYECLVNVCAHPQRSDCRCHSLSQL
ncbi:hypothetical protein OH76DRAFT_574020 [Lentinus brumalis]|uniref:Uncharacterized protein n=1 Tax=Lentinus brumalis TaxID=2498619 RepID=A0A371DTG9_9APHY|nr:hypothetical protein OH76DRAFT_574020 [Polyporus brumalis]